jgi:hypothetical protein
VRRFVVILVLASLGLLATGGAHFIHVHQHEHEDANHSGGHDESTCILHLQLRAPLILDAAVPLLVLVGLFIAFLTLLPLQRIAQVVHTRISCRGPPALASIPAA